jgi:hypothetical protein
VVGGLIAGAADDLARVAEGVPIGGVGGKDAVIRVHQNARFRQGFDQGEKFAGGRSAHVNNVISLDSNVNPDGICRPCSAKQGMYK